MRRVTGVGAGLAMAALLAGCSTGDGAVVAGGAEISHIHGIGVDPDDPERVLVATHTGLYEEGSAGWERVGTTSNDLMGFTVGPQGVLYASGHPGEGDDGPAALGLMSSGDGGTSWDPVALSGKVDFHALDASTEGIAGYDGMSASLRVSADGRDWQQLSLDVPVGDIAVDDGGRVLVTTPEGLLVSEDLGGSFRAVSGAPPLVHVDVDDDGAVLGVDADGTLHASTDLGSWDARGELDDEVFALTTGPDGDVWIAGSTGLQRSIDGGRSFDVAAQW